MEKDEAVAGKPRGRPRSFDRDAALERAMLIFWRHGYEATSIQELTTALQIAPPSLYAAFGDKQRLFLEAVARYRNRPGSDAECVLQTTSVGRDAIGKMLELTAQGLTTEGLPAGCMLILSALTCSAQASDVQAELASYRRVTEAAIAARLERARDEDELPRATDIAGLASFYMTVIEGMSVQARDGASRSRLLAVAHAALQAWPAAPARPARKAARPSVRLPKRRPRRIR
jgi:TetR/AcrR family transcriptional regulator, copper-responsive repressor